MKKKASTYEASYLSASDKQLRKMQDLIFGMLKKEGYDVYKVRGALYPLLEINIPKGKDFVQIGILFD